MWLDRLSRGTKLILWGLIVTLIGLASVHCVQSGREPIGWLVMATVGITATGCAAYLTGIWLITTRAVPVVSKRGGHWSRAIYRGTIPVAIAETGFAVLANTTNFATARPRTVAVFAEGLNLAASVCFVAGLIYLGHLCERVRNIDLSRRARSLAIGLGLVFAILLIRDVISNLASRFGLQIDDGIVQLIRFLQLIGGVGGLILLLLYVVLLEKLGQRLRMRPVR